MADRIRADELARRLAQSKRKIQEMAAAGRIPSAAKIGAIWTFDPDAIDARVRSLEAKTVQRSVQRTRIDRKAGIGIQPDSSTKNLTLHNQLIAGRRRRNRGVLPSRGA
jgi:hypothetical protein